MQIQQLENDYIEAANELRSKQVQLGNYADELENFVKCRDELKDHSEFSGMLPKTFFSGGDLDPVGICD